MDEIVQYLTTYPNVALVIFAAVVIWFAMALRKFLIGYQVRFSEAEKQRVRDSAKGRL